MARILKITLINSPKNKKHQEKPSVFLSTVKSTILKDKYTKMDLMLQERGFSKETYNRYTLEISKSRKIIIDINVISITGKVNAMYLKQFDDVVSIMSFKLGNKKDVFHLKLMIDILKED